MKSYTDLKQSKKLTEILPLESADFIWLIGHLHTDGPRYELIRTRNEVSSPENYWPCWSLAALLDNIPQVKLDSIKQYDKKLWRCCAYFASNWHDSDWYDNPVDAGYEMIMKLNGLNLL